MENEETLEHFENTIQLYKKLFRIEPEIIAYDMHPDYLSTRYALEAGTSSSVKMVAVQHHHAHIASCLAENGVKDRVIGVAFDGTGYGSDGTIWGGEFLLADCKDFQRVGHFEYMPLPGGAAAIKKPYRLALSYLYTLLGDDFKLDGLPLAGLEATEIEIIKQQLRQKINSPPASSAGRLFDAVSALAGVRGEIDYEAQAAIELEMLAPDKIDKAGSYPFSIEVERGMGVVKLKELLAAVVADIRNKVPVPDISLKFHNTAAEIVAGMCKLISKESKIKRVGLSGGVFQNRLLLKLAVAALKRDGFEVLTHRLVPANDGGISLGQAVVANFARI
jgi:hydrogenase maturation protein HypF